jgi:integrase
MFDLPNNRRYPIFISALGEIIWSATIWIHTTGVKSASGSKKTIQTYTEHMVSWLTFLEKYPSDITDSSIASLEDRIEHATEETLLAYRNIMRDENSERTGKPLETATINDRTGAIQRFYIWADKKTFFTSKLRYSPTQYSSGYAAEQENESYRIKLNRDEKIPTLVPVETFHRITALATESERLAYRWILSTGARRSEACALSLRDIPDTSNTDPSITPLFDIDILRKGAKRAPLKAPFHLVEELNWYIALERMPEIKKRKIPIHEIPAQPVFVNSEGNRFSGDHFGARFRAYPTLRLAANSWVHTEEMENGQESATSFHWRNILSESGLSHSARTQLIAEAKEFFSWLLISLGSKRRRSKISTIGHQFDDLRSLLKWMASMKYSRFNDIEPDEIVNFFSFRVESRRFYSGKKLQARSITGRFQLLKNLHQFYLHRSFGLWFDPGTEVNIERLRAGAPKDKYTFLPEANVLSHLNDATNWIHGPALEFLDAIDQCAKLKNESGGDTLDHENDFKIFRDSIQDEQKLRLCSLLGLPPTTTIGKLLLHGRKETYGACIFIIFYMTGLRVGSLITLSADCITSHTHSDGVSYLYLAGHLLKNQKREHYWIANELVVDAINLLARISQPLRTISGMAELFTSMKGLTILPRSGMDFNVKGARDINDILKYFCHSKLRTNILGTDTRIHAHQGRISFAKFVAAR